MRPIRRVLYETVFHRVETHVVHVRRKVPIVAYRVLPIAALPNTRSPRLVMIGDRDSPGGQHFTNAVLIARHRPGRSAPPGGQGRCGRVRGCAPGEPRRAICRSAPPTDPN